MDHIGKKEIFFVVLFLILLGMPVSAENVVYQDEDCDLVCELQLMDAVLKCLRLNEELTEKHKFIETNTYKALAVFSKHMKMDVFAKVKDRTKAYLDHSEELLRINREALSQLKSYETRDEVKDAINAIAYNQTIVLMTLSDLCVFTEATVRFLEREYKVARIAGNRELFSGAL